MPELPEVETIRRALSRTLPGRVITAVDVRNPRLRWPVDEGKLRKSVVGNEVLAIARRAKYLIVDLQHGCSLILHLGMSGQLLLLTEPRPMHKHDHVVFHFDDGAELRFRDPRRFGMVDAVAQEALATYRRFVHLGAEPLAPETTPKLLWQLAQRSKRPIKNLLMDASFIVGVGNIYANEALFYAGVHPETPSSAVTLAGWQELHAALTRVLNDALASGGTTLNDFVNSNGETGYFQRSLAVYGREGEPCPVCGESIRRIVQVGRSTFFCPSCQPQSA